MNKTYTLKDVARVLEWFVLSDGTFISHKSKTAPAKEVVKLVKQFRKRGLSSSSGKYGL